MSFEKAVEAGGEGLETDVVIRYSGLSPVCVCVCVCVHAWNKIVINNRTNKNVCVCVCPSHCLSIHQLYLSQTMEEVVRSFKSTCTTLWKYSSTCTSIHCAVKCSRSAFYCIIRDVSGLISLWCCHINVCVLNWVFSPNTKEDFIRQFIPNTSENTEFSLDRQVMKNCNVLNQ